MKEKNYNELIEKYIEVGEFNKAKKLLLKIKDKMFYLYYLAEIERNRGFFDNALNNYLKLIKVKNNISPDIYIDSCLKVASILRQKGDIKSIKYINYAYRFSLKYKMTERVTDIMLEKAMYYRMISDFKKAERIYKEVLKYYEKVKDYTAMGYIMWAVGGIYRLAGKFRGSINSFKKAIYYAEKSKDKTLKVYSLLGLAGVLRISGHLKDSYLTYYRAHKFCDKDDNFALAYSYCGMGNAQRQLGKIRESILNYKKSAYYYRLLKDKLDLGLVYWGLGESYKKLGKFKKAIFYLDKADALFKDGYEKRGQILSMISRAQIYYLLEKTDMAKKIYKKAIKLADKEGLNTYLEIFT